MTEVGAIPVIFVCVRVRTRVREWNSYIEINRLSYTCPCPCTCVSVPVSVHGWEGTVHGWEGTRPFPITGTDGRNLTMT